jgi:hypothetical protein
MNETPDMPAPSSKAASGPVQGDGSPAKQRLNDATKLLFFLVTYCHTLADRFGVSLSEDERKLIFSNRPRPWLVPDGLHDGLVTFDPDEYAKSIPPGCSSGEYHLHLFVLNLWNPHAAKAAGHTFDLFTAARVLDSRNLEGICHIVMSPAWP